jgi:capsular exopolysaccharide synthesis family protein
MDFRTFVGILRLRWMLVAGALLACLTGAAAVTVLQNKAYQASATILLSFSGATDLNEVFFGTQAVQERLSSYAAIAAGHVVAQRAVEQLHDPMGADVLETKTESTFVPKSQLVTVTVTDGDPKRVAALADAMADQFAALVPTLGGEAHPKGPRPLGSSRQSPPAPAPDGQQVQADAAEQTPDQLPAAPTDDAEQTLDPQPPAAPADAAEQATDPQPFATPTQQPLPVARATVMERPEIPDIPVSPVPMRNMTLGLIAGVLLGVGVALTRDATDRTIRSYTTLEQLSDLPTLAELAGSRGGAPRFGTDSSSDDGVRGLRDRLLGIMGPEARRVLVTAPFGGEGTTTTALNLALAFAELDERVVLIEGDPRRAVIAGLLNIDSGTGLNNALAQPDAAVEKVYATSVTNLFVLGSRSARRATPPCGAYPAEALEEVLKVLSAHFDRIVIDGPPVLATADTRLLAGAADGTVLVVRAARTTGEEVTDALFALRPSGAEVTGTVLTNARVSLHTKAAARSYQAKLKGPT